MEKKLLTVSVAAYNAAEWLDRCLESFVISEIMEELEIIIINDGSQDETVDIARKYVEQYPNTFFLIDKKNGGHGSTINVSIKEASGKYYKIVDADDWVTREGLLELVNCLKQTEADLVLSPYYLVDTVTGRKKLVSAVSAHIPNTDYYKMLRIQDYSMYITNLTHASTYKTCVLKHDEFHIDEHCFYVDEEYNIFALLYLKTVTFLETPLYCYLYGTEGQSVNPENMRKRRAQHQTVCKSVISFYCRNEKKIPVGAVEICKRKMALLLTTDYKIILSLEDWKQSYKEFVAYDHYIKEHSSYIYHMLETDNPSKWRYIIRLIRNRKRNWYRVVHAITYKMINL